jgi:hypothetical protein
MATTIRFYIAFLCCLAANVAIAQEVKDSTNAKLVVVHREVGLNVTALLDRFLPFGMQQFTGTNDIMFKRYRNDRAFKFGLSIQKIVAASPSENGLTRARGS